MMHKTIRRQVLSRAPAALATCLGALLLSSCLGTGSHGRTSKPAMTVAYPSDQQISQLRMLSKRQREFDRRLENAGYPNSYATHICGSEKQGLLLAVRDDGKLYASSDNGKTWRTRVQGVRNPAARVYDIVEDAERGLLYIATGDGVYQSRDAARSWRRFSEGLPYEHRTDGMTPMVLRLSLDPQTGDLYSRVALDGFGIYKTACAKPAWKAIGDGLPVESITTDVGYSPADRSVYIVNGSHGAIVITGFKTSTLGVFRGSQHGRDYAWTKEQNLPAQPGRFEPVSELVVDPNTGDLYACTYLGLFRKSGDQWLLEFNANFVGSAVFEKGGTRRAVAVTADRLFLRTAGGWQPVTSAPWNEHAIVVSAGFLRGAVYVSTNDGLFVSRDSAAHWARVELPAKHGKK